MGIRVINATYATNSKGNNVTEICQAIVDTGNDDIGVNNDAMGGDPDVGATKFFGITFTLPNGTTLTRGGAEGDTVDLVQ
jgi:hypothetical protein